MTLQDELEKSAALTTTPKKIVFVYTTGALKGTNRVITDAHTMCAHLKLTSLPTHIPSFSDGVHPPTSFGLIEIRPRYAIYREIDTPILSNTFHPEQI